jgi:hypothetical protein
MAMKLVAVRKPLAARLACCRSPFIASTKAFVAQVTALYLIGLHLADVRGTLSDAEIRANVEELQAIPEKISEILEKMRQGKLADIEALKQMKLVSDDVVNKKDESLPEQIESQKGSDVFYRNLRTELGNLNLSEDGYISTILDIFTIIKSEAIVDWYKNADVKRKMRNSIDDYLYDIVKGEKGIAIDNDQIKVVIETVLLLAEHNFDLFS